MSFWSNQVSVSGLTLPAQGMQKVSGSVEHLTLLSRPNRIICDNPLDPFTHKHARKLLRNTLMTNFWELVKRVPDIIQRDQMPATSIPEGLTLVPNLMPDPIRIEGALSICTYVYLCVYLCGVQNSCWLLIVWHPLCRLLHRQSFNTNNLLLMANYISVP